jgi:hypothetical protein
LVSTFEIAPGNRPVPQHRLAVSAFRPSPRSILQILFVLAVLFPYVQIFPSGTDIQPTALCAALVVLMFNPAWITAPRYLWLLGILFFVAVCVFLVGDFEFAAVRSVGNYASLFFIALASYSCAHTVQPIMQRLLAVACWVYFVVAVIQSVYSPDFLAALLPDLRRSASRGVVSLTPEPGYYATICFLMLLALFLYNRERSLGGLLCVAQITLLARSTLFTGILLVALLCYAVVHLSPKKLVTVFALLLAGWIFATQTNYFDNTRIGDLTKLALSNPAALTKLDLSISDRVAHLVFSFKGAYENWLMPNGFTSWGSYYHSQTLQNRDYFLLYFPDPFPVRIQSGIGAPLYELGVFGVIPIVVLFAAIRNRFGSRKRTSAAVFTVSLLLALLPGTPIATPIYGFMLGQLFAPRNRPATESVTLRGRI